MKHWISSPGEDYGATRVLPMDESRAHGFYVRSLLWRTTQAGLLTVAVAALLSAGCASTDRSGSATAHLQEAARKAEDLQVVDCLLPAQARKVGRQIINNARQVIKTSASDCEIRGGSQQGSSPILKADD